jgi:hypothetical protein
MNLTDVDTPSAGAMVQLIGIIKGQRTANCSPESGTWSVQDFQKWGLIRTNAQKWGPICTARKWLNLTSHFEPRISM